MSEHARVLIVGGGVAGLSTAYHLARSGVRDVVLLERDERFASRASGLNAAILRSTIEEPTTAELARRSKRSFLSPPPGFTDRDLVPRRGLVLMANRAEAAAELESLCGPEVALGRGMQRLDDADLARLVPHIRTRPLVAFFARDDGVIDLAALMDGFVRGARAGGARLATGVRVERLLLTGGAVTGVVDHSGKEWRADEVWLAAGGWTERLASAAGSLVRLLPTRRHLAVTAPDPAIDPAWPVVWNGGDTFYCRPEAGGLMLSACDQVPCDPDVEGTREGELEAILAAASRHLVAGIEPRIARAWIGLRTLTVDDRFAIGADPHVPGLFWVAGLGGHGITTAFEVGRLAAAYVTGRAREDDVLERLAPARLAVDRTSSVAPRDPARSARTPTPSS